MRPGRVYQAHIDKPFQKSSRTDSGNLHTEDDSGNPLQKLVSRETISFYPVFILHAAGIVPVAKTIAINLQMRRQPQRGESTTWGLFGKHSPRSLLPP